jgi:hypothetical protein
MMCTYFNYIIYIFNFEPGLDLLLLMFWFKVKALQFFDSLFFV